MSRLFARFVFVFQLFWVVRLNTWENCNLTYGFYKPFYLILVIIHLTDTKKTVNWVSRWHLLNYAPKPAELTLPRSRNRKITHINWRCGVVVSLRRMTKDSKIVRMDPAPLSFPAHRKLPTLHILPQGRGSNSNSQKISWKPLWPQWGTADRPTVSQSLKRRYPAGRPLPSPAHSDHKSWSVAGWRLHLFKLKRLNLILPNKYQLPHQ